MKALGTFYPETLSLSWQQEQTLRCNPAPASHPVPSVNNPGIESRTFLISEVNSMEDQQIKVSM